MLEEIRKEILAFPDSNRLRDHIYVDELLDILDKCKAKCKYNIVRTEALDIYELIEIYTENKYSLNIHAYVDIIDYLIKSNAQMKLIDRLNSEILTENAELQLYKMMWNELMAENDKPCTIESMQEIETKYLGGKDE